MALEAAGTPFYLIASDLCLFSPTLYDSVTRDLQKELGIDPKHVLWSVTHSHATPEIGPPEMYKTLLGRSDHDWDRENTARTLRALIDAVRTARDRLEPAQIAFGSGIALAIINRRAKDVDGRVSIGLNPEGPVDRRFNPEEELEEELARLTDEIAEAGARAGAAVEVSVLQRAPSAAPARA